MTKEQATQIAYDLIKAVKDGRLTKFQARNQFKLVVYNYQQNDRFKQMQDEHPNIWTVASKIME